MTISGGKKNKEIQTLIHNMEAFNKVTTQLQNSYDELQKRVKKLDLELSDKNEELKKNNSYDVLKKINSLVIIKGTNTNVAGHHGNPARRHILNMG